MRRIIPHFHLFQKVIMKSLFSLTWSAVPCAKPKQLFGFQPNHFSYLFGAEFDFERCKGARLKDSSFLLRGRPVKTGALSNSPTPILFIKYPYKFFYHIKKNIY